MNSLNSVLIEGFLVGEPQIQDSPAGAKVCTFEIESNRYYAGFDGKIERETSCFAVDVFGRLAETCGKVLREGRGVRLVGRIKQEKYHDADGKDQYRFKVIAEHVEFKPLSDPGCLE